MQTKTTQKNGETNQRIFLLSAWRESNLFSKEEKLILSMTEEITLIHYEGLSSETYKKAEQFFDKNVIAQIIISIVTINAWNRIAVSTHMELGK